MRETNANGATAFLLACVPAHWRNHPKLPWLISGLWLSLALGAASTYLLEARWRLQERLEAQFALGNLRDRLDRELGNVLAMPETMAVFIAAQGGLQPELLEQVSARLLATNSHLRVVGVAPGDVVSMVYPRAGNEKALGLDYRTVPAQGESVERARRTRRTVVAGPIDLVQGGRGLASRTPVFVRDGGGERYWGVLSLLVDADGVFRAVGFDGEEGHFAFAARGTDEWGHPGKAFAGHAEVFDKRAETVRYSLPGGRVWVLGAVPRKGWGHLAQTPLPIYLLPLFAAMLMGGLSYALAASHQRVLAQAMQDQVTGLANRRLFNDRLHLAIAGARRYGRQGALLLIDLDRFKPVNDSHGHAAGDTVLRLVGQRLQGLARDSDTVARVGGDEFALILPELANAADAVALAERVLQALSDPFVLSRNQSVGIGACVGVALFPKGQEAPAGVFARADQALYRGKRGGRGQVCVDGCEQGLDLHPGENSGRL